MDREGNESSVEEMVVLMVVVEADRDTVDEKSLGQAEEKKVVVGGNIGTQFVLLCVFDERFDGELGTCFCWIVG